jgi:hypothetical protein
MDQGAAWSDGSAAAGNESAEDYDAIARTSMSNSSRNRATPQRELDHRLLLLVLPILGRRHGLDPILHRRQPEFHPLHRLPQFGHLAAGRHLSKLRPHRRRRRPCCGLRDHRGRSESWGLHS